MREGEAVMGIGEAFDASFCFAKRYLRVATVHQQHT